MKKLVVVVLASVTALVVLVAVVAIKTATFASTEAPGWGCEFAPVNIC